MHIETYGVTETDIHIKFEKMLKEALEDIFGKEILNFLEIRNTKSKKVIARSHPSMLCPKHLPSHIPDVYVFFKNKLFLLCEIKAKNDDINAAKQQLNNHSDLKPVFFVAITEEKIIFSKDLKNWRESTFDKRIFKILIKRFIKHQTYINYSKQFDKTMSFLNNENNYTDIFLLYGNKFTGKTFFLNRISNDNKLYNRKIIIIPANNLEYKEIKLEIFKKLYEFYNNHFDINIFLELEIDNLQQLYEINNNNNNNNSESKESIKENEIIFLFDDINSLDNLNSLKSLIEEYKNIFSNSIKVIISTNMKTEVEPNIDLDGFSSKTDIQDLLNVLKIGNIDINRIHSTYPGVITQYTKNSSSTLIYQDNSSLESQNNIVSKLSNDELSDIKKVAFFSYETSISSDYIDYLISKKLINKNLFGTNFLVATNIESKLSFVTQVSFDCDCQEMFKEMYDYFWNYKKINFNKDILEYYGEIKAAFRYLINSNCIIEAIKLLLSFFYTYIKVLEIEELRNDYEKIKSKVYETDSLRSINNVFLLETLSIIVNYNDFRTINSIKKDEILEEINIYLGKYGESEYEYVNYIYTTKFMLLGDYSNTRLTIEIDTKIDSYIKYSLLVKRCLALYYLGNLNETISFIETIENKDDEYLPFDATSLNITKSMLCGLKGNYLEAATILSKHNVNYKIDGYMRYVNFIRQQIELFYYTGRVDEAKIMYENLIRFLKDEKIYDNIKYFETFTILDRIIFKIFLSKYNFKKANNIIDKIRERVNKHKKKIALAELNYFEAQYQLNNYKHYDDICYLLKAIKPAMNSFKERKKLNILLGVIDSEIQVSFIVDKLGIGYRKYLKNKIVEKTGYTIGIIRWKYYIEKMPVKELENYCDINNIDYGKVNFWINEYF